jgi:hypothetical protein
MIIGFGYKKRVGKDTGYVVVKSLVENRNVYRVSFAAAVKDEIYDLLLKPLGMPFSYLEDESKKELFRPLVQWYATEFRRNPALGGYEDYWVDKAFDTVAKIKSKDPTAIFVITDTRFPNEMARIKKENGVLIHVERNTDTGYDSHSSENLLDNYLQDFDYRIDNNGTLEQYKQQLHKILELEKIK